MGLGVILGCRCGGCPCLRGCFSGNFGLTAEYGGVYLSRYLVDFGDDAAQVLALVKKACGGSFSGNIHHFGINADAVAQNS